MPESEKDFHSESCAGDRLRRRITGPCMTGVVCLTVHPFVYGVPLFAILPILFTGAGGSINWAFFLTQTPKPVGEAGGGMANAIVGSDSFWLWRVFWSSGGVGAGIYLAEYGRNRLGDVIRLTADVLNGVPFRLLLGLWRYPFLFFNQETFFRAGWRVALAIMMIPRLRAPRKKCCCCAAGIAGGGLWVGIPRWGPRSRSHCAPQPRE